MSCTVIIKDKNLKPENIKKDVVILKVKGTLEAGGGDVNNQNKTVSSSTSDQTVTYDSGYTGLGTVTVNKYTLDSKTVNSSTSQQVITSSADGLSSVTVNPYTLQYKQEQPSTTQNLYIYPDNGYDGLSQVKISQVLLGKETVDSSTVQQIVTATHPLQSGLQSVTVNPYTLDTKTVDPSTSSITVSSSADGMSSVTVNAVTSSIDANIQAGNIKKDVSILGVVGTYEGSGGDGDWVMKAKAGTLTDLSSYHVGYDVLSKDYGMYGMFCGCSTLTKAPTIDTSVAGNYAMQYAFKDCTSLTDASFPELTSIDGSNAMQYAFQNCTSLTSVSFPKLTSVSGNSVMNTAFSGCTRLTDASFPELTSVSGNSAMNTAFKDCTRLTGASFPKLTSVSSSMNNTFSGCTSLRSVSFPELTSVSGSMNTTFSGCTSLTSVSLPKLTTTGTVSTPFNNCPNLTTFEISPVILTTNNSKNLLYNLSSVVNLTVNGTITDNVYLLWQYLSPDSVYNVLTALDLSVSGKKVQFISNFIVEDYPDRRISTAYDTAILAGWDIININII